MKATFTFPLPTLQSSSASCYKKEVPRMIEPLYNKNFGLSEPQFDLLRNQLSDGNQELMQVIFKAHYKKALTALKMLGCPQLQAEDVVAEAWAKYSTLLLSRNEQGTFKIRYQNLAALFDRVCRFLWHRKRQIETRYDDIEGIEDLVIAEQHTLLDMVINEDLKLALEQTFELLCDRCALLLRRFYVNGEKLANFWQELGDASLNAATVRLHGCRGKFKSNFSKKYSDFL
jgi:DNA-directed RNA polymerase specialized sigma24 family protein